MWFGLCRPWTTVNLRILFPILAATFVIASTAAAAEPSAHAEAQKLADAKALAAANEGAPLVTLEIPQDPTMFHGKGWFGGKLYKWLGDGGSPSRIVAKGTLKDGTQERTVHSIWPFHDKAKRTGKLKDKLPNGTKRDLTVHAVTHNGPGSWIKNRQDSTEKLREPGGTKQLARVHVENTKDGQLAHASVALQRPNERLVIATATAVKGYGGSATLRR